MHNMIKHKYSDITEASPIFIKSKFFLSWYINLLSPATKNKNYLMWVHKKIIKYMSKMLKKIVTVNIMSLPFRGNNEK